MKHFPVAAEEGVIREILDELSALGTTTSRFSVAAGVVSDALKLTTETRAPVVVDLPAAGVDAADKEAVLYPNFNEEGLIDGYNLNIRSSITSDSGRQTDENNPVKSMLPDYHDLGILDWLIAVDDQGRITFISSSGFSTNHFNGKRPEELFRPDVAAAYRALLKGENPEGLPFRLFINPTSSGHFAVVSGINPFSRPEELYASSHQFINYVFDTVPTDIAIWTLDHRYLYANSLAIANPELREWIIGKTDFDYCDRKAMPYAMAAERRNMFNRALATNKPHQWIETINTPAGDKHLLRVFDAIRDKDGKPLLMAGYAMDITGRINSENAFQKIIRANDRASDGIALCNAEGVYFYMNQKHAEIFDYEHPQELIGKSWKFIYPDQEIKRLEEVAMAHLAKEGHWTGVTYGKGKTGRQIVQEISLTAMEGGELICICRDISERMKQSEEMRKLAIVAKHTLSSVVIMDTAFRIEWVNNTFLKRTGLTMDEIRGRRPDTLFTVTEEREKVLSAFQKLENGEAQSGELMLRTGRGNDTWIFASVAPVFDEMGKLVNYISVDSDITIYKKAEEQLMKNLHMEKALGETKSRFVSLASHELRTPLMALQARLDISRIRCQSGADTAEMLTQFDLIQHEIGRITEILDKVLIAGKLGRSSISVNKAEIEPVARLQQIAEKLTLKEFAQHRFEVEERGKPGQCFRTDPTYFDHIFNNLLSNSAKFSGQYKVTRVLVNHGPAQLKITVTDRGIGIPSEDLPDIFDLFHRGSNARNIRGTGLGLYIVKYFVNLLGGTVSVDSALNKGTSFTVTLPYT